MRHLFPFLVIFSLFATIQCGSGSSGTDPNSLFSVLPKESGDDGICTVTGLGSQIRSGFTDATTQEQTIRFQDIRETSYAVVRVSNANIGTVLELTNMGDPDLYPTGSCPLPLDTVEPASSGSQFASTRDGDTTKITFLRSGSYMTYSQLPNRNPALEYKAKLSGTPQSQGSGSSSAVGDLTFNQSCKNDGLGLCTNIYGTEKTCGDGETETSEKCSAENVFGVCRIPKTDEGYRFTVFYNNGTWNELTAQAGCTAQSGTFSSGYSEP